MDDNDKYSDVIVSAAEFIKDRLYFVTLNMHEEPESTQCTHYFNIDYEFTYESFFSDFGPLNLSMLYHYCVKVNEKLKSAALQKKRIVHYTRKSLVLKRVNSAYLIASYAILYLDFTPEQAYSALQANNKENFVDFRDASAGNPYYITLLDCLKAIYKAHNFGFFNFNSFDHEQYEYLERVENGDLNWIIPNKFIAFCGPHNKSEMEKGYPIHSPETYFPYFRSHNVTTIIRLNKKVYDSNKFVNAGFDHKDLYFVDGSTPSDRIMNNFIDICEKATGAIAVHCKAGLGRTGSLIGCYLMKHYQFTAHEAIAWIRICRPGSIIGHQQNWLETKQAQMWKDGEAYRRKLGIDGPIKHTEGIYSLKRNKKLVIIQKDNVSGILQKVDTMKLNDKDEKYEDKKMTQGDKLNQIKAQRNKSRTLLNTINGERRMYRSRVLVSPLESSGILRTTKVSSSVKTTGTTGTKRVTKRNGFDHTQIEISPKRCSQRFANSTVTAPANGKLKLPTNITQSEGKKSIGESVLKGATKKSACLNGNIEIENVVEMKNIKRAKRSLNIEKEKSMIRSIKVLRRSHPQSLPEVTANKSNNISAKFQLPVVKITRHNI